MNESLDIYKSTLGSESLYLPYSVTGVNGVDDEDVEGLGLIEDDDDEEDEEYPVEDVEAGFEYEDYFLSPDQ